MSAPDRKVVESLAKVIIAVAWSDDRVSAEEIACLKDVLFQFQYAVFGRDGLSKNEWGAFDLYLASPVTQAERDRLVDDLRDALQTSEDHALALSALEDVVQADGVLADAERQVRVEIEASLESAKFGLLANLEKLIGSALGRRAQAMAGAPNRDGYYEDFLKNRVYVAARIRLDLGQEQLDLSDADLRKLAAAGGLMAKVALRVRSFMMTMPTATLSLMSLV